MRSPCTIWRFILPIALCQATHASLSFSQTIYEPFQASACPARDSNCQAFVRRALEFNEPLTKLELSLTSLENSIQLADKKEVANEINTLSMDGGNLWEMHLQLSYEIDLLGNPLRIPPIVRPLTNQNAKRLGRIRDRITALNERLGSKGSVEGAQSSRQIMNASNIPKTLNLPQMDSIWKGHRPEIMPEPKNTDPTVPVSYGRDEKFGKDHQTSLMKLPGVEKTAEISHSLKIEPPPGPTPEGIGSEANCGFLEFIRGCPQKNAFKNSAKSMAEEQKQVEAIAAMRTRGGTIIIGDPKGCVFRSKLPPISLETCHLSAATLPPPIGA